MPALLAVLVSGCVAYVPTEQHTEIGMPRMVSVADFQSLAPGETTRADVVLRFGAPTRTFNADRFFVYHWDETSGYVIIAAAGPAGGGAVGIPVQQRHDLCLEFTRANRVRRFENLESGVGKSSKESVDRWIASAAAEPAAP